MSQKRNLFFIRSRQTFGKLVSTLTRFKVPNMYIGENSVSEINHILLHRKYQVHNCMIVTGPKLVKTNMLDGIYDKLKKNGIDFCVFSDVLINPTIENVEEGIKLFKDRKCEAIIAFGGGSVIDVAKCILARSANPNMTLQQMEGKNKIKNRLPLLVAIPTTCGSGSESTFSAVISDEKSKRKLIITDFDLLPKYIILDPKLLNSLSSDQIAQTGMDAFSHAVEAYISFTSSGKSDYYALEAIKLLNTNLEIVTTKEGANNTKAKENLLLAAHYAGLASSRAGVGYIDALAHAISSKYKVPHGLLTAILMPYVLESYGEKAHFKLASLADGITYLTEENDDIRAKWMIDRIKALNSYLGIKNNLKKIIDQDKVQSLASIAYNEAQPFYPTPKILDLVDLENILYLVLKDSE